MSAADTANLVPTNEPPPALAPDEQVATRLLRLQLVTTALVSATTEERVAEVVVDHGVGAVGAATGGLYLVEPGGTRARMLRANGYPESTLERFGRIALDAATALGDALRTGESILLETREEYERRYPASAERMRDMFAGDMAFACVPLLLGEAVIGGLSFGFQGARRFGHDERSFLELLARHAAQAIERIRLLDAERAARAQAEVAAGRLRLLAEVSRAFSAAELDLDAILGVLAGAVTDSLGDSCTVLLASSDGRTLRPAVLRHRDPDAEQAAARVLAATPAGVGESLPGKVAKEGQPLRIPVVSPEALREKARPEYREHLGRFPVHSLLIVPIRGRSAVSDVLVLSRITPGRPYTDEDQELAEELAARAALAIAHSRAYHAERAARERLTRLQDAAAALAGALTRDEVARIAVEAGCTAVEAVSGLYYAATPDGDLELLFQRGVPEDFLAGLRSIPRDSPLPGAHVARTRSPIWIEDQEQYEALSPELAARAKAAGRAMAFAAVPLVADDTCYGVVSFGYRGPHAFSEADRVFIAMLAHHAAQASHRARLIERTARAAREAEDASRFKDEFLATVSHELRTPLSAILGWAATLRNEAEPAASARGLDVIERNASAQLRIVDDLLDVSRIVRGKLRLETNVVDVAPLAREVLELVQPAAIAKRIELVLSERGGPCRLVGDRDRLRQILWNLLSNAIKFTPASGRVRLRIEQSGGKIVIIVSDNGRGIDSAFLPHVFERFRQADGAESRASGGLGLGLAIVRHLAEMHGGTVAAESDGPGTGATFTVTLPVRPFTTPVLRDDEGVEATGEQLAAGAPQAGGVLAGKRILIVEDEDDARYLIEVVLSRAGAIVLPARSAPEALEKIDAFEPEVLLSDIGLPQQDGYWLVQRIRERRPALPAIALTAFGHGEDVQRARGAGFDTHVTKPVAPRNLVDVVARAALGDGSPPGELGK